MRWKRQLKPLASTICRETMPSTGESACATVPSRERDQHLCVSTILRCYIKVYQLRVRQRLMLTPSEKRFASLSGKGRASQHMRRFALSCAVACCKHALWTEQRPAPVQGPLVNEATFQSFSEEKSLLVPVGCHHNCRTMRS